MSWFPNGSAPVRAERTQRIEYLKQYFLQVLAEDQMEGSQFDCDVLDAIKKLEEKYPPASRRGE